METSQQQPPFHDPAQETPNLIPTTPVEPANPTPIPNTQPIVEPSTVSRPPLDPPVPPRAEPVPATEDTGGRQ